MPNLPAKTPPIKINLIPEDPFLDSIIGKFLVWALSIGRYIVVLTELIVILSFLSRFKLDRDLTDLNESIAQQKAIILSYRSIEEGFLSVQSRIDFLKQKQRNNVMLESLTFLKQNVPIDVKLTKLALQPAGWSMSASALSAEGLKTTIDRIVKANPLSEASLGSVKMDSRSGTINFDLRLERKQTATPVKPAKKAQTGETGFTE